MKADHKRCTVVLYQCDLFCLLGILQLQVQAHAQTYTHTHHTARLDLATRWLHHCFMANMANTYLGYGSGMERNMERKAGLFLMSKKSDDQQQHHRARGTVGGQDLW